VERKSFCAAKPSSRKGSNFSIKGPPGNGRLFCFGPPVKFARGYDAPSGSARGKVNGQGKKAGEGEQSDADHNPAFAGKRIEGQTGGAITALGAA
jgi:hypothetical protein